jgi:hypothetical protein
MLPFTRAQIKASIKHSDQPEMWEDDHSGMIMIATFSKAAGSKDMEQNIEGAWTLSGMH